jgi:hypothetical protein
LDIQYNRNEEFTTSPLVGGPAVANGQEDAEMTESSEATVSRNGVLTNDDQDVETTVIFLPNVWSLMPNSIEYQRIMEAYKRLVDHEGPLEAAGVDENVGTKHQTYASEDQHPGDDKDEDSSDAVNTSAAGASKSLAKAYYTYIHHINIYIYNVISRNHIIVESSFLLSEKKFI